MPMTLNTLTLSECLMLTSQICFVNLLVIVENNDCNSNNYLARIQLVYVRMCYACVYVYCATPARCCATIEIPFVVITYTYPQLCVNNNV